MAHKQSGYILQSNTQCITACCPIQQPSLHALPTSFKKDKKFINLTITKHKQPIKFSAGVVPQPDLHPQLSTSSISEQLFRQDKSSFLQQIRNFSPGSLSHSYEKEHKSLDSTKEMGSSQKNQENMLGHLLESMSNQIFSEMFVSSAVKGKVVLSGSLGSISEVKSEMELSNQTQGLVNVHFTEEM